MKAKYIPHEPATEHGIYTFIADWMKFAHPEIIWFFEMSGVRVHPGTRAKIKHMRSDRGIPDLIILEPRGGYNGLLIEIKKAGSNPYTKGGILKKDQHIQEQNQMLLRLMNKGYYATFATGLTETQRIINIYLNEPK